MRIAFFCTRFPCISETFVLSQLAGLLDKGFEIDIHAIHPGDDDVLHPTFEEYGLQKHTSYRGRTGSIFGRLIITIALIIRFGWESFSSLNALRKLVKDVPEVSFAAALFTLRGLRSRPQADLIYAHFGPNGQIAATLKAAKFIDIPVVTVFHGFDVTVINKKWGPSYYQTLFKHGALMLPVSEEFKKRLIDFGCSPEKIRVHHMGVDIRALKYVERSQPAPKEAIRVLTIARLVEKKGVTYGIQAVNTVARDHGIAIEFNIVGDGDMRTQLEAEIVSLGCGDIVHMVGWKNSDDVQKFIEEAHIYMAPSITAENGDEEGIPVVLMEAAASGLPLLSTHHSGIPELVRQDETGLLAEERDAQGLGKALLRLCQDAPLRKKLAHGGRALVEKEFEIESLNEKLAATLKEQAQS